MDTRELELLQQDAVEMAHILSTAKCRVRHSIISHDRLSEILVAIVTDGRLASGNAAGYDVISPRYGLIEVKSRILGTDGPWPRVSLRGNKIAKADYFVAVRWTRDTELHEAIGLPKSSTAVLYAAKQQQGSGLAHISWPDWISSPDARSFRAEMIQTLR